MRAFYVSQIREVATWAGRVDTAEEALATFERVRSELAEAIAFLGEADAYAILVESVQAEIDRVCGLILAGLAA